MDRTPPGAPLEPEALPTGELPAPNPWMLRPFFGRGPRLEPTAVRTLALVSLGLFFENYDIGLVNAALPQIAEELEIAAGDTGFVLAAVRLGGIGTFLLLPFADRIGRRRMFLAAILGMSAGTFATAFSQTPAQFAALQMATRVFMLMGAALALVILVEEFPADRRGAGIGLLSVLGGMGFGLGAGLYALVDWLPFGWRALYALGVLPVLLLPFFRRSLRETRRFEAGRRSRDAEPPSSAWRRWMRPVAMLARTHPRRAVSVGMAGMLAAMGAIAFFQYTSYFVRNVHGWSPGQYSLLVLTGGLLGLCGNVLGGRASDRFGRRRVGFLALALAPAGVAFFYGGPASTLALAWGLTTLCATSGDLVLRALATELFPTSHRSAAAGWLILVQTLGWVSGLFVVGAATGELADLGPVVTAVSLANVAAALCVWLVPETSGLELETIGAEERT